MNLFDALKQYFKDAAPGGSLNPEVTPQGLLDVAAMASTPVPVVGDVLGLAADAKRLYDNPSERTAMNYGMSALGLLPFVPAGMFIGKGAKTWDAISAAKAKELADKGVDARQIWRETGTFKGPDGHWRQEIPDNLAKYDRDALRELKQNQDFNYLQDTQPMGGVLGHEQLYKAYPDLSDMQTHFMPTKKLKTASGSYSRSLDRVTLADIPSDQKSIALHEIQHAIQQREGWPNGGSTSVASWADAKQRPELLKVARKTMDDWKPSTYEQFWGKDITPEGQTAYAEYLKQWSSPDAQAQRWRAAQEGAPSIVYKNLAGEAEARATQARMNMNAAQRRDVFPLDSYDVPIDQLIIRGGLLDEPAMSIKDVKTLPPRSEAMETARKNAVEMLGQSKTNSPMDRAADLGFTTPAYHATAKDFEAFKPGGYDPSISGHAVWVSPYADVQPAMHNVGARGGKYREGANVMPLMVKSRSPLMLDDKSMLEWAQDVYAGGSKEFPQTISKETADALIADGYDSIKFMGEKLGWGPKSDEIVMLNPKNIRSRFAAFDPARVNESDLLGRADPRLLGLMGVLGAGGLGGAYLYNQDKK